MPQLEFAYFNLLMQNSSQLTLYVYAYTCYLVTWFWSVLQNEIYSPKIFISSTIKEAEGDDMSFRCLYFNIN